MDSSKQTYLALGDSYTIGEGVDSKDRYPSQLVTKLASKNVEFDQPIIVATTGWTTDELQKGIEKAQIKGQTYDLVTLLIGVNNQYRGRSVDNFQLEFKALLLDAITFARGNTSNVIVLSIPDWGVTPFAAHKGVDKENVKKEIDAFNIVKKSICLEFGITFLDITAHYRQFGHQSQALVADELHPSYIIYDYWSDLILKTYKKKQTF
ncbi:SGNH/GDSL hydrolase family protein [Belliella kenyensis]|uniref:SGNH/GDSL hydrolase family protein n=1 Tax=Belliella kenyensis TaxID=1472724 RepID=A0ABV8EHL8_9BACT|nr:SGNH/GDSL hydrolase family protein [Belliella kenyensis]MCH7400894.1 SGNH/GDSL hydrolase family protein [Belliella kenyensis]MDN3603894.1 SGNH/GDSL hydrolase family protein [Belliella kenyensis]